MSPSRAARHSSRRLETLIVDSNLPDAGDVAVHETATPLSFLHAPETAQPVPHRSAASADRCRSGNPL